MEVRDLNFYYDDFQALKNINIDIADKKVTAFIGPSGCGKSTLLRTFNRMYDLYPGMRAEGTINLDGKNVLGKDVDVNLLRAQVGMVVVDSSDIICWRFSGNDGVTHLYRWYAAPYECWWFA